MDQLGDLSYQGVWAKRMVNQGKSQLGTEEAVWLTGMGLRKNLNTEKMVGPINGWPQDQSLGTDFTVWVSDRLQSLNHHNLWSNQPILMQFVFVWKIMFSSTFTVYSTSAIQISVCSRKSPIPGLKRYQLFELGGVWAWLIAAKDKFML